MTDRPLRMVGVDALRDLMVRLLVAAGSERENAETAAGVFLEADLRGVGLQGLDHLPDMVRGLRNGKIRPDGKPEVVREGLAFALVDGNGGPGQPAGLFAADLAAEKAKAAGSSIVGVVNSSDVYLLGYYGERIARHGMVGLVPSDGTPTSRPFGGAERVLGSNPLVIAIPRAGRDPIVLDISDQRALHVPGAPRRLPWRGRTRGRRGRRRRAADHQRHGHLEGRRHRSARRPQGLQSRGSSSACCRAFWSAPIPARR